jgi:uncharacterized protein (DUF58 family)
MSVKPILDADERDRVAHLQLFARSVVDGITVGLHRSPHKGFSAEFKEHRPYVQGDEIRSIDWKLYGKTDRLFIRQFEEETNLRCTMLVDQSGSMGYRGTDKTAISKHEYAIKLAASLAYLLIAQRDAVGLGLVDSELHAFTPPRSNPGHLQLLMHALSSSRCGTDTNLSQVLNAVAPRIRSRGMVILISDCFDQVEPLAKALSYFRVDRSEVVVFQIWNRDELEFPFRRRMELLDLERPGQRKIVDPASIRKAYLERVKKFREDWERLAAKNRIDLVPCVTDQPHAEILSAYLASRGDR